MTTYYIAEAYGRWEPSRAKTLAGAKVAASRAQVFQGTDLFVGVSDRDGVIVAVAKKMHRDKLDMNATGGWRDLDPPPNL